MADSAVVGILRALLTADTAQFDAGMRKAVSTSKATEKAIGGLGNEVKKLTPQAERMVKAFQGDKLLYQANNIVAAVTKLGGAQKLTQAEQARVNSTLTASIAKYTALGQTAPKAMVDLAKATQGTTGPLSTMNAHLKSSIGLTAGLGAAVGTFAAQLAGQAIRSVISMGKEAFTTASALVDMATKTGLSTESLQRLDAVGGQAGVTLEAFSSAAFKLGNRLAGRGDSVRQAVRDLHLDLDKLLQMSPDARLFTVLTALSTHVDRNKLGVELFGRSFESISAAVVANFGDIANAAKVSSDAQLQALDVAGDRWDLFVKNTKASVRSLLGDLLLASDEIKKSGLLTLFGAAMTGSPLRLPLVFADIASGKAQAEKKKTADQQAAARAAQTKTEADYVAQLKQTQAELKKLDAAERKQIAAARELGADTDDITEMLVKFGISSANAEGALKLLSGETKKSGTAAKDAGKEWQNFIDRFTGADTMETALNLGKAIGTSQINLAKLTKEQQEAIAKALEAGAEAWKVWGGVVPAQIERAIAAINKFKHSVLELPGLTPDGKGFKSQITIEPPSLSDIGGQLEQFEKPARIQEASARAHAKVLLDIDISRMEASIRQAERAGAKKTHLLEMESILAQRKREAALADAEDAFNREIDQLEKTSATYTQEYQKREQEYTDHVTQINETWAQGEAERRDMYRRESSFWASELGKQISGELKGILHEITGKLASTLFGGVDGEAKQRAKEAREDYERIAKSGKASAEEITRAFRAMREAEAEAHSRWADKFKSMWNGIKRHLFNIFDQILGAFVNNLLKGMLTKLAATNLGGKLLGFLGLGGGGGGIGAEGVADIGGGLLGKVPGVAGMIGLGGAGAAGSLGTLAGAPIMGASGSVIGTAGATAGAGAGAAGSGAAAGIAGALGKIAPVIGAAAGIYGLIKNKGLGSNLISGVTAGASIGTLVLPGIGTAIGAGLGAIAGGLRSLFSGGNEKLSGFGGGHLAQRLGDFRAGNLRPTIPQHSFGSMGRAIAQNGAMQQGQGVAGSTTFIFKVETPDAEGFDRLFDSKIIPRLKRELNMPRHGIAPLIQQKVLG